MRYFDIQLTGSDGQIATAAGTPLHWTTHPKGPSGPFDANYPLVVFDAQVFEEMAAGGFVNIQIFGVPLALLRSTAQLVGMTCTLKGGMVAGLPLVVPINGTLLKGTVWQAIGNWQGVNQSLLLVVSLSWQQPSQKVKILFQWKPGQSLAAAITAALQPVYGPLNVPINVAGVASNYTAPASVKTHKPHNFSWFCDFIYGLTEPLPPGPVKISATGKGIVAYTQGPNGTLTVPIQNGVVSVTFNELIGQPTWIDFHTVQVKTAMRSDLDVMQRVTIQSPMGPGFALVTPASQATVITGAGSKYTPTFKGQFLITQLRHVGNSRSSDAREWATIFNCISTTSSATSPTFSGVNPGAFANVA